MTILHADRLTKIYRDAASEVRAVVDVSLTVDEGETIAIMGPSGSGKTTLLSMLGGILRPTSGTVTLAGQRIWDFDERELPLLRRRHVGFIFQTFNLFSALTAAENVEAVLNLKGVDGNAAQREALRLLDQVGLSARARFLPQDLSGGERQRVSIARALGGNPSVILADEPTANLDWENGRQILGLLKSAAHGRRRCVIIVTHDPRSIDYIDRTISMEDGRLRIADVSSVPVRL